MQRILSVEQDKLLRRERALVEELRVVLARLGAPDDDLALLRQALQQMDELFLIVIVGEFNAGKTAFINATLGDRLLAEGVLPTTHQINILRHGRPASQELTPDDILLVNLPVDWLEEINLVDTPGTNAVIQRHQEITEQFIPRSDLVIFVTSADRPFSESERQFLERIRQWGKKVVFVVNKIDLIGAAGDRAQVVDFVTTNARQLLGVDPHVFAVSARQALQAKQEAQREGRAVPSGSLWEASRFAPLERYVRDSLDASERMRLKFTNPLGVAGRLLSQYSDMLSHRKQVLRGDFAALDKIEEQLAAYEADMRRDFRYHLSHVDNVLYAMADRGDRFFDETLRFDRIFDLINSEKLRGAFERDVVADTSREVERQVNDLIDWIVGREYEQWQAVTDFLQRQSAQYSEQIVGKVGRDFEFNRQEMLDNLGHEAQRVVDSYDRRTESLKLTQHVQNTLLQTAAVEVSALGLGTILVVMLHTTLLDFTGILGASVLAAVGLYVLPYQRSRLKQEFHHRVSLLRDRLTQVLAKEFETELRNGIQRMHESVGPYTRFVRVERDKLEHLAEDLEQARAELAALRDAITRL